MDQTVQEFGNGGKSFCRYTPPEETSENKLMMMKPLKILTTRLFFLSYLLMSSSRREMMMKMMAAIPFRGCENDEEDVGSVYPSIASKNSSSSCLLLC